MNMSKGKRAAVVAVATAAVIGGSMTAGIGSADAATPSNAPIVKIVPNIYGVPVNHIIWEGSERGTWEWSQDPEPNAGFPGDAMRVTDNLTDGWGVEADLDTGRVATTAGHNAIYTSPWATGDLPEDHWYGICIYLMKGGVYVTIECTQVES
jgi:hypothetical protein